MSIYVTGDVHGLHSIQKFNNFLDRKLAEGVEFTKDDYMIVCGDMGCVFFGGYHDKSIQDFYETFPWTTLFIDGNHENFNLLGEYPVEEWHGGKVHKINDSLIHLMRGQVFDIDGHSFYTMGGANSIDKAWRVENVSWWEAETPSWKECVDGLDNFEAHNCQVDYVLTHAAPTTFVKELSKYFEEHQMERYLDIFRTETKAKYQKWYFGHYHIDKFIEKYQSRALYDDIVEIG